MYEYSWDHEYVKHIGPTAGIGMINGEPCLFDNEEQYREAYYAWLNKWLVWA